MTSKSDFFGSQSLLTRLFAAYHISNAHSEKLHAVPRMDGQGTRLDSSQRQSLNALELFSSITEAV